MEKNTVVNSDDDITVSEHNYSLPKVETRTSVLPVFLIIYFIINDYRQRYENFYGNFYMNLKDYTHIRNIYLLFINRCTICNQFFCFWLWDAFVIQC